MANHWRRHPGTAPVGSMVAGRRHHGAVGGGLQPDGRPEVLRRGGPTRRRRWGLCAGHGHQTAGCPAGKRRCQLAHGQRHWRLRAQVQHGRLHAPADQRDGDGACGCQLLCRGHFRLRHQRGGDWRAGHHRVPPVPVAEKRLGYPGRNPVQPGLPGLFGRGQRGNVCLQDSRLGLLGCEPEPDLEQQPARHADDQRSDAAGPGVCLVLHGHQRGPEHPGGGHPVQQANGRRHAGESEQLRHPGTDHNRRHHPHQRLQSRAPDGDGHTDPAVHRHGEQPQRLPGEQPGLGLVAAGQQRQHDQPGHWL